MVGGVEVRRPVSLGSRIDPILDTPEELQLDALEDLIESAIFVAMSTNLVASRTEDNEFLHKFRRDAAFSAS